MADEEKSLEDLQEEQKSLQKEQENLINKQSELSKKQQKTTEDLAAAQKELADANKSLANKLKSAEKSISDLQNQGYNLSMFLSDASGKGKKFLIESTENNLKEIEKEQKQKEEYNKVIRELTSKEQEIIRQANEKIKNLKKENELSKKEQAAISKNLKENEKIRKLSLEQINEKAKEEDKKRNISYWKKFENFMAGGGESKDSFEQMLRVRQRFGGIEQIFSGNIVSGTSQLLGSFKSLARIMGGPYAVAIRLVISGLLQLDKAITALNKQVFSSTGGIASPLRDASMAKKREYILEQRKYMRELNITDQEEDIYSSIAQKLPLYLKRDVERTSELTKGLTYGRTALTSMGVNKETADSLLTTLYRREGLSGNQSNYFIAKMVDKMKDMGSKLKLTENQVVDETMKSYDANKKFNLSMGWINNQVLKFNKALENGTRTAEDFAAVQKSLYAGDTGQLAGLANIVAESAVAEGVEIPQELLQNLNNPYALKMLMSDPEVMKKLGPALQATAKRMTIQSGQSGNELAEQGFLGDLLQQMFKINVSRQAVIDLQKNNYDFAKAGLLGIGGAESVSKRIEDQKNIDKGAEEFRSNVQKYQDSVTTIFKQIEEYVGNIKDHVIQKAITPNTEAIEIRKKYADDSAVQRSIMPSNPTMAGL